jgi:hypothetical protein
MKGSVFWDRARVYSRPKAFPETIACIVKATRNQQPAFTLKTEATGSTEMSPAVSTDYPAEYPKR